MPLSKPSFFGEICDCIEDATPWFAFSLGKTWFLSDNPLRVSRILRPACAMCCNLPIQLKTPPFPRITEIFVVLACATLSRTQTDTLGPPGLHLCCNLPLQFNIPPFLCITEILAFVGVPKPSFFWKSATVSRMLHPGLAFP